MLRPLGLGDFLTGIPAYRAVKRAFPDLRLVLAAPSPLAVLTDLSASIDEVHPTEPLAALDADLNDADVAVDLHGCGPASQRVLLAARPHRLVSFANAAVPETAAGAIWKDEEHEVERWCRMLSHAGIPADPDDLDLTQPGDIDVPAVFHGATLVHVSAASESRRWPVERWIDVARSERENGRRVILTGDRGDVERVNAIAAAAGIEAESNFAGRTTLRELASLVAVAGRVVCGDTGVAHLATAYRTPSIVLFGPIAPAHWGPPPQRPYHRALWAGRSGDPHGQQIDPGLLAISTQTVIDALADHVRFDVTIPLAAAALM